MRVLTDCLCFCMPFRVFVCFGHSWAVLGRSWALLGRSWASPGQVLDAHGALLGHSWTLLGRSWGTLGRSWAPFGGVLRKRVGGTRFGGPNLEPKWSQVGAKILKKSCSKNDASSQVVFCSVLISLPSFWELQIEAF